MFDRSTANPQQIATVDAVIAAKGDLNVAATTLGINKNAIRARIKRLKTKVEDLMKTEANATAPKTVKARRTKQTPKAARVKKTKTKGRYERVDGPVTVLDGPSRLVKVAKDHPAAQVIDTLKEIGGSAKASPTGLRLSDDQGREFAVLLSTKKAVNFYVERVALKMAKEISPDLGTWAYAWPLQKKGCAVLIDVTDITKGLLRTLMKLHATHAVDGRTKEARAAA